ncbi:hypothetical protein AVEN_106924-1, partial [Araneus ventricosus]
MVSGVFGREDNVIRGLELDNNEIDELVEENSQDWSRSGDWSWITMKS